MKKFQNSKVKGKPCNIQGRSTEEMPSQFDPSKKEHSAPKFNRKTQSRPFTRKKSEATLETQQHLIYISPNKTTLQLNHLFHSPKFEDMTHRFTSSAFQSTFCPPTNSGKRLCESAILDMEVSSREIKLSEEISSYKKQIEDLKVEIEKLENKNEVINQQLKELDIVKMFLVERQAYIYQLTQTNLKQSQDILMSVMQKETLQTQITSLRETLSNRIDSFNQECNQLLTHCQQQYAQINTILTLNTQLKKQLKTLKRQNPGNGQNIFQKRYKENQESLNRSRRRVSFKSKSAFYEASEGLPFTLNSNLPILEASQLECSLSTNGDTLTLPDLSTNLTNILDQSSLKVQELSNAHVLDQQLTNESTILQEVSIFDEERCDCSRTIKKLKQQIRYSEIEIDILKKLKHETQKVRDDNNKLKAHNRKLLNRIDYLAKQYNRRRRRNSDSSLELSLSPKKL